MLEVGDPGVHAQEFLSMFSSFEPLLLWFLASYEEAASGPLASASSRMSVSSGLSLMSRRSAWSTSFLRRSAS